MTTSSPTPHSAGVVVIGRNEGPRLAQCLRSVAQRPDRVVYVDSGSTDGSVALAHKLGVAVLPLDLSIPFTAGRARNEGFRLLLASMPQLRYVQFVDGDCEVADGWIVHAVRFLDTHPGVAAVCGRRRERHPERSVYNMLCDIEWDTVTGETRACGGDALMRVDAFRNVDGFASDLIAGEEPELCVRLRAAGWRIWRIAEEMTLHDAAMLHFGQWWKRNMRGGYAFAAGADRHGTPPERHWVRESRSVWLWGLALPLLVLAAVAAWGPWALSLLVIYPLQISRLARQGQRAARDNWLRAVFLVLGKFPEMLGQVQFIANRSAGNQPRLIEYK